MWAKTRDALVIVEPGTPAGYARIIAGRARLIASGAHVAAPCPHDRACPLQAPDWCHFAQRLPRSRAHMQMKGAEVPFEDEKFSYVVLTRTPLPQHPSRVLAPPVVGKAEIAAKLCTPDGVTLAKVARRHKPAYARARRWSWGAMLSLRKVNAFHGLALNHPRLAADQGDTHLVAASIRSPTVTTFPLLPGVIPCRPAGSFSASSSSSSSSPSAPTTGWSRCASASTSRSPTSTCSSSSATI
jgi:hypothetical protein